MTATIKTIDGDLKYTTRGYITAKGDTVRSFTAPDYYPGGYYKVTYRTNKGATEPTLIIRRETGQAAAGLPETLDTSEGEGKFINNRFLEESKKIPIEKDLTKMPWWKRAVYTIVGYNQDGGNLNYNSANTLFKENPDAVYAIKTGSNPLPEDYSNFRTNVLRSSANEQRLRDYYNALTNDPNLNDDQRMNLWYRRATGGNYRADKYNSRLSIPELDWNYVNQYMNAQNTYSPVTLDEHYQKYAKNGGVLNYFNYLK